MWAAESFSDFRSRQDFLVSERMIMMLPCRPCFQRWWHWSQAAEAARAATLCAEQVIKKIFFALEGCTHTISCHTAERHDGFPEHHLAPQYREALSPLLLLTAPAKRPYNPKC